MVLLNFGVDDIMQTAAAVLLVTRIAYFTMGLPIMLRFVLLGRAVSLWVIKMRTLAYGI